MVVAELKERGYTDVRPLEKLLYTDGVTYEFQRGMYFTGHTESETESTIFNSKLKKLERKQDDIVGLRIKNAASHDPSEWNARREKSKTTNVCRQFNTKKIRAALRACDAGISITEFCGIVPVFKYDPPSSFVSHYEIETKEMRDRLVTSNKIEIENRREAWWAIKHPNGGRRGSKNRWTAAHHELVARYEIRNTDGAIRHKYLKKILGPKSTLCGMVDQKVIQVRIERHRAYMWTFMEHKKRRDQNIVDHIDGDHSNNAPWNLRWVSEAENHLAKHSNTERIVPVKEVLHEMHGAPSDPKEWHGWAFYSNMWIARPGPDKTTFVARSTQGTYPVIQSSIKNEDGEIEKHNIQCHQIVAYLHRIWSSDRASDHLESLGKCRKHFQTFKGTYFEYAQELKSCGLVIMHDDNDKANYTLKNLKIGTPSENVHARHDNPETTLRKRVDLMDPETHKRIRTFDSHTQAAEWLGHSRQTVSMAICINRTREIGSYRVTTHKFRGVTYYVVDAV